MIETMYVLHHQSHIRISPTHGKQQIYLDTNNNQIHRSIYNTFNQVHAQTYTDIEYIKHIIHTHTSSRCESFNHEMKVFNDPRIEYWSHSVHRQQYVALKHNAYIDHTVYYLYADMCKHLSLPLTHTLVQSYINKWIQYSHPHTYIQTNKHKHQ